MHKIWLIIKREYLVRVRKKSFIVMTILGPLLMVSLLVLPAYLASESQEERIIAISEEDKEFNTKLEDAEFLHFTTIPSSEVNKLKNDFSESPYYALLDIDNENFTLYASQQISLSVSSKIENQIEQILEHKKLKQAGIRTTVYWMPIHEFTAYNKHVKKSNIKTTSKIYDEILSLPLFPNISKRHQDAVINCIKSLKNN